MESKILPPGLKVNDLKRVIQFLLKYKAFHILFWIYQFSRLLYDSYTNHPNGGFNNWWNAIHNTAGEMLSVYVCIYILIPRLFIKEKYFRFTLAMIGVIACSALIAEIIGFTYLYFTSHTFHFSRSITIIMFIVKLFDTGNATLTFIIVYLIAYFFKKNRLNKKIEKERLESELNFLKAQFNPHFLFNALNSIYVLMKEDLKLSEQTLLRFSSLLRYQLYDCNKNETTLEKEIDFLKDYIELEKVRSEHMAVNFSIPDKTSCYKIAPFIIIPFVENAFKHISHFRNKKNEIDISIAFSDSVLNLAVINTYDVSFKSNNGKHKGIGLQNVKRRLELLYPGKYNLEINNEKSLYSVNLNIHLNGI